MKKIQDVKLAQTRCQNLSCQMSTACSRLVTFFDIKNRSLVISRLWKWEMCFEGVEVGN